MFKTRLLSGIVLMIITIALMIFGGLPLFWVITLITVIGLFELYRAVKMEKTVPALIGYAAVLAWICCWRHKKRTMLLCY